VTTDSQLVSALIRCGVDTSVSPLLRRIGLVTTIGLTMAISAWFTREIGATPVREPELVRVLHAMVGIKGLIALAAAGLVLWRLGRPIKHVVAVGYAGAICVAFGAVVWLWGLANVPLGSLVFYGALMALILVARTDSDLFHQHTPS
jgi:hypothetical protein